MNEHVHENRSQKEQPATEIGPEPAKSESVDAGAIAEAFSEWVANLQREAIFTSGFLLVCDKLGCVVHSARMEGFSGEAGFAASGESIIAYGRSAVAASIESGSGMEMAETDHTHVLLKRLRSFAVPVSGESGNRIATIGMMLESIHCDQHTLTLLRAASLSFSVMLGFFQEKRRIEEIERLIGSYERESRKRDLLYEVGKRLHAKIDVNAVLGETLDVFRSIAPGAEIELFLSQDHHSADVHVKPIIFNHHSKDIRNRAYIQAEPIMEVDEHESVLRIAIPVSGNQGIYGVLQLVLPAAEKYEPDLTFLSMVAEIAGSAFENARLYEHSNALINELRLINEITRRLNQSLKIKDVFNFASSKLISIFGAEYSCILQVSEGKLVVQASNIPGLMNDRFQRDEGFAGVVMRTKEPLIVSDYETQAQIHSKMMEQTSSRSLIAAPIIINQDAVGVVFVTHRKPNFFSYDNYKLLQVLSDHIGLAISNASLHAEVRRMAITDRLTGLYARHFLDEQINSMQKKDFCGALILIDVDNFKDINDTFGHQVGDQILIQVSQIIKSSIRDTDTAARWGGEEFAIYLPQTTVEHTFQVTDRIRRRISEETNPGITISCGISDWNWDDEKISVEHLFFKADTALYEAKHRGKNIIIVHAK